MNHCVLLVGDDERLAGYRAHVIGLLGVRAESCRSKNAMEYLKSERFDAVVLGYTLKDHTARNVAEEARRAQPHIRVVRLAVSVLSREIPGFADAVCPSEPRLLLRCLAEQLGIEWSEPEQRGRAEGFDDGLS